MVPVKVATKPFIKTYLSYKMPGLVIDRSTIYGSFLMQLLQRDLDHHGTEKVAYSDEVTLFTSQDCLKRNGGWVNFSQARYFNNFVSNSIKTQLRIYIQCHLYYDKRLCKAVDFALEQLRLTDLYNPETAIKDFQRWREEQTSVDLRIYKQKTPIACRA